MRIVMVVGGHFPEQTVDGFETAAALKALGHEVNVVSPAQGPDEERRSVDGVEVEYAYPVRSTVLLDRTMRVVRLKTPSVVHVYASRYAGIVGSRLASIGVPRIIDVRSGNVGGGVRSFIGNFRLAWSSRDYDGAAVIHPGVARLVYRWGCRPGNVATVNLGINTTLFRPLDSRETRRLLGYSDSMLVAMYHGVLNRQRRIESIVEAANILKARGIADFRILILGYGETMPFLRQRVAELGLQREVQIRDAVPYQELPRMINAVDVGLAFVPQTWWFQYQPPRKTLESLSCGKPVIATATVGNRLFVRHGGNGILCSDSPRDIAAALEGLSRNRSLLSVLAANARGSVLEYEWQRVVDRELLPLYEAVMNQDAPK